MSTTTIANPLPDGIAVVPPLEHVECAHVEFFEGTKEHLQAIGIGVGVASRAGARIADEARADLNAVDGETS